MRSPAEMGTIQIDITNACTLECSNCTRFCGNHEKSFFMDYETFKKAVDSLDGYNGVIGVMGGEPTLHPEFERFVLYLQGKFGKRKETNRLLYPEKDFIKEIRRRECESHVLREREDGSRYMKTHGVGLWSNMSASYRRHYEIIQDTFQVQYLNDHLNPSYHQPGLFSRKDLGIPDEEWIPMRDKCWIQNEWSATITPKGCFFCEIAGALDMLFNGPGGWPIEAGWWKRKPEDFKDQLHWCDICGFALDTFVRNAEEQIDDVSPSVYKMLEKIKSHKRLTNRINVVEINDGVISEESKAKKKDFESVDRYLPHYEDRFCEANSILYNAEFEKKCISNGNDFGKEVCKLLNGEKEWILLYTNESSETASIEAMIGKYILNPGTLHVGEGYVLFSKRAFSIRNIGYSGVGKMHSMKELMESWDSSKIISIADLSEKTKLKRDSIKPGARYAIWGAGIYGDFIADAILGSGGIISLVVDSDCKKEHTLFYGVEIENTKVLKERMDNFDYLIISPIRQFEAIKKEIERMGIPREKYRLPYEM